MLISDQALGIKELVASSKKLSESNGEILKATKVISSLILLGGIAFYLEGKKEKKKE